MNEVKTAYIQQVSEFVSPDGNGVAALENETAYEVPCGLYNWMEQLPSVQRVLKILWIEKLVYPQWHNFDIIEKIQEFYQLVWDCSLIETETEKLSANGNWYTVRIW